MDIDQIKELKFNRLNPEEQFLIDMFDGLELKESKEFEGYFLYVKHNYCYFYYNIKNKHFYYDYLQISLILNYKFGYDHNDACNFVKYMVVKYLNPTEFKTFRLIFDDDIIVKKYMNL